MSKALEQIEKDDQMQLSELSSNPRFNKEFGISAIQRALRFGYNRSARLVEWGLEVGFLKKADSKPWLYEFSEWLSDEWIKVEDKKPNYGDKIKVKTGDRIWGDTFIFDGGEDADFFESTDETIAFEMTYGTNMQWLPLAVTQK